MHDFRPTVDSTHEDLVKKVLDELLLEGPRSQETVEVGAQELGHEVAAEVSTMAPYTFSGAYLRDVHVLEGRNKDVAQADDLWREVQYLGIEALGWRGRPTFS
jgi:hypothetical protein